MILLPAIDVRGGQAVRLVQGDYARETVFDADPVEAALRWAEQGAQALHVVDLDGARAGAPQNLDHLRRICSVVELPVQFGGGLRRAEDVDEALAAGASRVILGTAAVADPALIDALTSEHGERIVVGADAKSGRVAVEGWERESAVTSAQLVGMLVEKGARAFVYTPVELDGTLSGPGLEGLREVCDAAAATASEVIYSGGIGELAHLRELAASNLSAVSGVIVGRALYEGRFTIAEAERELSA